MLQGHPFSLVYYIFSNSNYIISIPLLIVKIFIIHFNNRMTYSYKRRQLLKNPLFEIRSSYHFAFVYFNFFR